MTPAGHAAMMAEIKRLTAERPRIAIMIETAREHGDLKENAEYHAAKEKQGMNEGKLADFSDKVSRADVIDPSTLDGEMVKFGATVELEELASGKLVTYQIVGQDEADIEAGTISVTSPVARALIRREVGDEVKVKAPGGLREYEIVDVRFK